MLRINMCLIEIGITTGPLPLETKSCAPTWESNQEENVNCKILCTFNSLLVPPGAPIKYAGLKTNLYLAFRVDKAVN